MAGSTIPIRVALRFIYYANLSTGTRGEHKWKMEVYLALCAVPV